MTDITLVDSDDAVRRTHPVMAQLRPHLDEAAYVAAVRAQRAEGYRLVARWDAGAVAAVAGFRVSHALALGRHLYVDDLVTDAAARSRGHGRALLDWLIAYGAANGCVSLHLDSGVQRHAAHRFYLRERLDIVFYHFSKQIRPPGTDPATG